MGFRLPLICVNLSAVLTQHVRGFERATEGKFIAAFVVERVDPSLTRPNLDDALGGNCAARFQLEDVSWLKTLPNCP
jgi:hypothetical protein